MPKQAFSIQMKKTIALITGGYSGESVISYKTAATIEKNIDTQKWNCYTIDITLPDGFIKHLAETNLTLIKMIFLLPLMGIK